MAPVAYNHFDGYAQGPSTLTKWKPLQPVPGLAVGGWHDAGDDDLRIESQAGEVYVLALAHEAFGVPDDDTTIDEQTPPGRDPPARRQARHPATDPARIAGRGRRLEGAGAISARRDRADAAAVPDDRRHRQPDRQPGLRSEAGQDSERTATTSGRSDDRLVFTEQNPARALTAAAYVAAGARAMRGFDDATRGGGAARGRGAPGAPKRPALRARATMRSSRACTRRRSCS